MYHITHDHEISVAHRLVGHAGGCGRLHGHNYLIQTDISTDKLDDMGMVLDFAIVKDTCDCWLDQQWDHRLLIYSNDPLVVRDPAVMRALAENGMVIVPFNPTAENMAFYLTQKFSRLLATATMRDLTVAVTVQETSKGRATFVGCPK